jgi:phage terminase small subunit
MANSGLTPKQARFVEEYLVDLNAAAAARRAGYSENRSMEIGYQLLQKTPVQAAIEAAQRERSARTGITADRVIAEIAKIAFADPRKVMEWGPGGVTMKDSKDLTDADAAIVSEVSESISQAGSSVKVKLHSKLDALEKLARHVGVYDSESRLANRQAPVTLLIGSETIDAKKLGWD